MKILVDAMGGDNAPEAAVLGALDAVRSGDVEVCLIGIAAQIEEIIKSSGLSAKGLTVVDTPDVVDMHDDPASVIKKRPDSSMVRGIRMLAEGEGDAFVSAGSTGALLSAATLLVKRVKGVRRAAMGPILPTQTGKCVLMDCGANAECTPEFLLQFAYMGTFYARAALGLEKPRVALLNIGTEDTKGAALQKETYPLLKAAGERGDLNFIGNIEARDVPLGGADVVVTDGFSGNILLKSVEGTAKFMSSMMKKMFKKNVFTLFAGLLCKSGIGEIKKKMDSNEVGGTAFIGLRKPVIKAHGSSNRRAFECAVQQAARAAKADIASLIEGSISNMTLPKE